MFDGRLAENFKLTTGTWVTVGKLRTALVSAVGVLTDAVIAGHDRDYVAALAWVDAEAAASRCPGGAPALRAHVAGALAELNRGAGSAARIKRLVVLDEPPSIDAGEITDKGYINQRGVLERRAQDVARLFADPVHDTVITPAEP
jgi:feruloyl-CoA synthase